MLSGLIKIARKNKKLALELVQTLKEANLGNLSDYVNSDNWEVFFFTYMETGYTGFYCFQETGVDYRVFEALGNTVVMSGDVRFSYKTDKPNWKETIAPKVETLIQKDFASSIDLPFKKGEILLGQWSYNMTFGNFYRVLKCTPSRVTLQPLEKQVVGRDGYGEPQVSPTPVPAGKAFVRKIEDSIFKRGHKVVLIRNHELAEVWNGKPFQENHTD